MKNITPLFLMTAGLLVCVLGLGYALNGLFRQAAPAGIANQQTQETMGKVVLRSNEKIVLESYFNDRATKETIELHISKGTYTTAREANAIPLDLAQTGTAVAATYKTDPASGKRYLLSLYRVIPKPPLSQLGKPQTKQSP